MSDARRKRHPGALKTRNENGEDSHRQLGSQTHNSRGRNNNSQAGSVSFDIICISICILFTDLSVVIHSDSCMVNFGQNLSASFDKSGLIRLIEHKTKQAVGWVVC